MRTSALVLTLILPLGFCACIGTKSHARTTALSTSSTQNPETPRALEIPSTAAPATMQTASSANVSMKVDFATQIRPILESRCQPCHFPGGKVYQRLPFDRPETIKTLGTKLFTRIKDENERRLIREFLAQ